MSDAKKRALIKAMYKKIDYQFSPFKEYMHPSGYENSIILACEQILSLPELAAYFKEMEGN